MEKLVCAACGAALTPNTDQPYLMCEYCDTAVPNAFYAAPAVQEPSAEKAVEAEAEPVQEPSDPVASLVETVGGVARTLLQRTLINRSLQRSLKQRPVIQRTVSRPVVQHVRPQPHPHGLQPKPRVQHPHGMRQPHAGGPGRPMSGRGPGGPGRGRK